MKEMMSGKERILAAIHSESVDRVPWAPEIVPYTMAGMDANVPQYIPDFMEMIGADIFHRFTVLLQPKISYRKGVTPVYRFDNGVMVTGYETPVGSIYSKSRYMASSPDLPTICKFMVETVEDLKVFHYVQENMRIEYLHDFDAYFHDALYIGDRGLVATGAPMTPLQCFNNLLSGAENTYYLMADEPDLLDATFDLMHRFNVGQVIELAKCPPLVFISPENTGTTLLSPGLYEKYCSVWLNAYADIFHDAGKKYFIHMCGKLKFLLNSIAADRFDGVLDIAPLPTGDTELWECKEALCGKVVSGGIDCTTFCAAGPEMAYRRFYEVVKSVGHLKGLMIGSGDSAPFGTTLENLKAFRKALDDYYDDCYDDCYQEQNG